MKYVSRYNYWLCINITESESVLVYLNNYTRKLWVTLNWYEMKQMINDHNFLCQTMSVGMHMTLFVTLWKNCQDRLPAAQNRNDKFKITCSKANLQQSNSKLAKLKISQSILANHTPLTSSFIKLYCGGFVVFHLCPMIRETISLK